MNGIGSTKLKGLAKVVVFGGLLVGSLLAAQSASAASTKVTMPTSLTTCTVNGVTTVVPTGTLLCPGTTEISAVVWNSSVGLVTADRPYLGTLRYCINNSTATITVLSDGSAAITCKSTETQVSWTRTWGVPTAAVIRNVNVTGTTTAMVAYSDSTANNGSQIVKYVITARPGANSLNLPAIATTHVGPGSPTMKITGLHADTDYSFVVCATNAAGTTCTKPSQTVHTWPTAPRISLNSAAESVTYGNAIQGYVISELGGHSLTPPYLSTYSISPTPENGLSFDPATGLLSGTPMGVHSASTYTVTETNISGSASATFTLTVTPAPLTVAVTAGQEKVYGESDPVSYAYTSSGYVLGDTSSIITGSLTRSAGENVGRYAISQNDLSAGGNYTINFVGATFDITPATLTVLADSGLGKVYGSVEPAFTYSYSGFVFSDNSSLFSGALGRAAGEDVGTYALNQGDLSAGANYVLSFIGSDFTITPATLTVSADGGQGKVYGSADPALPFAASGFVNGDTGSIFTGSLSREAGENVGTYAINQNDLSAGDNYIVSYTGSDFTITPATPSFEWSDVTKLSTDPDWTLIAPSSSTPGTFTYTSDNSSVVTISGSTAHIVGVGTAVITATFTPTDSLDYVSGGTVQMAITVNPGVLTSVLSWSQDCVLDFPGGVSFHFCAATSTTAGTFAYSSSDKNVFTVDGGSRTGKVQVTDGYADLIATFTPADPAHATAGTVSLHLHLWLSGTAPAHADGTVIS